MGRGDLEGPPSPRSLDQARAHDTQVRPLRVSGPRLEPKPAFLAIANPPQGQSGLQASGLRVLSPISKSQSGRGSRTSVRPRGALGRAVWTEAAVTCQAACATSLHGARVGGGPESSRASSSSHGWPRRGRFLASQALGGRPSDSPSPPSPQAAWESLRGPRGSRAKLHDAGLRLASVPATATAWQQRAPGAFAINNQPAAAAVKPPRALRCKYAALSAPAHPAQRGWTTPRSTGPS